MAAYNTTTVMNMLKAAFNAEEVKMAAASVAPDVYANFAPGMSRNQMIMMLVEYAQNKDF